MRFLLYLLAPVPLAVLSLLGLHAVLALALPESGTFLTLLGYGYAGLGLQSLLFALAMRWLEPRCAVGLRSLLAAVLGGLCGGSLCLLEWWLSGHPPASLLFPALGVFAGLLTALVVDRLPGRPVRKTS
jgi:hypothetical protein